MIFGLLRWWYGPGWRDAIGHITEWPTGIAKSFSIAIVLKTLGSPWRRIITPPGKSIEAKMHAAVDNIISRMVGFVIRLLVLIAASILVAGSLGIAIIFAVCWPVLPIVIIACLFKGAAG